MGLMISMEEEPNSRFGVVRFRFKFYDEEINLDTIPIATNMFVFRCAGNW